MVGGGGKRASNQIVATLKHNRRNNVASDVEGDTWAAHAKQRLQLVRRLDECNLVVCGIGLKASKLKIEALEVELTDIPRGITIVIDVDLVPEVGELGTGKLKRCLGDQHFGERGANRENGLPGGIFELRSRL